METAFGFYVFESIIAAFYCYKWAEVKKIKKFLWAFYGFVLPVIALLHILYRTYEKEWLPRA